MSKAAGTHRAAGRRASHLALSGSFRAGASEAVRRRVPGLARELREELGIEIRDPAASDSRAPYLPLWRSAHRYVGGEPLQRGAQGVGWTGASLVAIKMSFATADLLPADRPIVRALRLPERLPARVGTLLHSQ